MNIEI
jgi:hypothetical protein